MLTRQMILENLAGHFAYALDEFDSMVFNLTAIEILSKDEMGELYDIHKILEELLGRIENFGKEVA